MRWVPRETEVTKDIQVQRVYKARLVLLGREVGLVPKVQRVGRAPWVLTDLPDLEVHAVPVVSPETMVKRVSPVRTQKMDHLVLADVLVLPVTVVRLVQLVPLALLVNPEPRVMLVPWVLWESWVLR